MSTATISASQTYTKLDIEKVVRRFKADILMMAQSTGAISEATAKNYANDIELLAKNGYLSSVDITLLNNGVEVRATRYTVNTNSGELECSRPGGVLWPWTPAGHLRVVLSHTSSYDTTAKQSLASKFAVNWSPTNADTSHSSLTSSGGRDYASNAFGLQRKDWA
jgi:hypothetical protein